MSLCAVVTGEGRGNLRLPANVWSESHISLKVTSLYGWNPVSHLFFWYGRFGTGPKDDKARVSRGNMPT